MIISTTPVILAHFAIPQTRVTNTGTAPIYVGERGVTPETGTVVAPGATVDFGYTPSADSGWHAVSGEESSTAEIVRFSTLDLRQQLVADEYGVPVDLLADEVSLRDLRDLAGRLAAWKAS